MRKSYVLMLVLAALGLAALGGCSLYDGGIYGSLSWTGTLRTNSDFDSTSGFPSLVVQNTSYSISEGSHSFVYYIQGGATGTPYLVSYSFERDVGTESNLGDDLYFNINCADNGYVLSQWTHVRSVAGTDVTSVKPDGVPVTIQKGAYKMTISVKRVDLTDSEKASFIPLGK